MDGEKFEHYSMNLLGEQFDFIPDASVDIVNARELFNSPHLEMRLGDTNGRRLKKILAPQIRRVLKPEGFFVYSEDGLVPSKQFP